MKKKIKCPICDYNTNDLGAIYFHIEKEHSDSVPNDMSISEFYYSNRTGKTHGSCIVCKKDTSWNLSTEKYHRFCGKKECKDKYIAEFKKRMIGKYGKVTLLTDPLHQRKMLKGRRISGEYKMMDGEIKNYTGSYELDFLKILDLVYSYPSNDIMMPSPHTYYYTYEGEKKFYIPDIFIPSLGVEIEIKDGGSNPNMHHKIQDVDKKKEVLKDDVLTSQNQFHYIKIVNKDYSTWMNFLNELKIRFLNDEKNIKPIFILGK